MQHKIFVDEITTYLVKFGQIINITKCLWINIVPNHFQNKTK